MRLVGNRGKFADYDQSLQLEGKFNAKLGGNPRPFMIHAGPRTKTLFHPHTYNSGTLYAVRLQLATVSRV